MTDEVIADSFNRMRGRILGLIESWGLDPVQEHGCKALFKSLSYDSEAEIKQLFDGCRDEAQQAVDSAAGLRN